MKLERLPDPARVVAQNSAAAPAEEEHRGGRKTGGATLDAENSILQHGQEDTVTSFSAPADSHPSSLKFYEVLVQAAALHDKKQRDYGTDVDPFANVRASEDFGIPAWLGCAVRMNDKIRRIMSFAQKGELVNESIEDAFLDLLVYAGIAAVLYREQE